MFEEEDHFSSKDKTREIVNRFEKMLKNDEHYFFDVDDFEDIIEYYIEESNARKALKVIDFALLQHPDSFILLLRKAQLLAATNKPQKSLDLLGKLENIEPTNLEVHLTKGNIFSQLRQHSKAVEAFRKTLEYAEEDIDDILLNIAFEYTNMGKYDKAISYLKEALEVNPENESALFELSFCFEIKGKPEDSIEYYNEFIDNHPYSSSAWFNLGIAFSKQQLYEKAIDAYDFAIAIDEHYSSAYFNKGNALASLEKYNEAIEVYKETFKYEEPDALAYYYIGECYEKLFDYDKAISFYRKASKLDPYLADAWIGIGMVLDEQGKQNESVHYLKKGVEIDKRNAEYWYILGDLQKKRGFTEEAQLAYEKVIELDTENYDIWMDYSDMFYKAGETDHALNVLYRGLQHQASTPNALLYYRITAYLLEKGYKNEATDMFTLGLELDFKNHVSLFNYAPQLENNELLIEILDSHKSK